MLRFMLDLSSQDQDQGHMHIPMCLCCHQVKAYAQVASVKVFYAYV
jgi:hypothetical protein